MRAFAIHTIMRRDKDNKPETVPASTNGNPSLFDIDKDEFERLERLGAVRKPTSDETAIFDARNGKNAPSAARTTTKSTDDDDKSKDANKGKDAKDTKAPDSGAAGDPKSSPKSASKDTSSDEDLGI